MRRKKSAFAHKRAVMSRVKRKLREAHQGEWVPAHGGTETPFVTRTGRRLLYVYQRTTGRHAYLDLDTDIVLTDDEAWNALGRDPSRPRKSSSKKRGRRRSMVTAEWTSYRKRFQKLWNQGKRKEALKFKRDFLATLVKAHKKRVARRMKHHVPTPRKKTWVTPKGGRTTNYYKSKEYAASFWDTSKIHPEELEWYGLRDPNRWPKLKLKRVENDVSGHRKVGFVTLVYLAHGRRVLRRYPNRDTAMFAANKLIHDRKGDREVFLAIKNSKGTVVWSWTSEEGAASHRDPASRRLKRRMGRKGRNGPKIYYIVSVPYVSVGATVWHPKTRASAPYSAATFDTKTEAHEWAKKNLKGHRYKIKTVKDWHKVNKTISKLRRY